MGAILKRVRVTVGGGLPAVPALQRTPALLGIVPTRCVGLAWRAPVAPNDFTGTASGHPSIGDPFWTKRFLAG